MSRRTPEQFIDRQIADGGVPVSVRTRDEAAEPRALAILKEHGGVAAHLRDKPPTSVRRLATPSILARAESLYKLGA